VLIAGLAKAPKDTSVVKIGFIGPLSGDAAVMGEPIKNSIDLAANEINKNGGINGRQIQMLYEDGKCDPKEAVTAAKKLVDLDKVKYIIGGTCSAETLSIIPITSQAKVVVISPSASAPKLSGISEYFLRNNPSDAITGSILAKYLSGTYKTAGIVSEKSDFPQGVKETFITEAEKDGMLVLGTEDFSSGITDFRSFLTKMQSKNPDAIFVNPKDSENFIRIIQQAKQLNIKSQLVGVLFGADPSLATLPAAQGIIFANLSGLSSEKGKDYLQKYKATYNSEPNYAFQDGAAYDDVYLIAQAIMSVGDDATKVAKYLYSLKDYSGVIGTYSFDENGDMTGAGVVLQKIVDGKLINL
jgi:branched-chain amino acid transport system substrate-binding protein